MRLSRISCAGVFIALVLSLTLSGSDSGLFSLVLRAAVFIASLFMGTCALGWLSTRPKIKTGAIFLFLSTAVFLKSVQSKSLGAVNAVPVIVDLMWIILMLFQIHYPPGAAKYLPALAKTVLKLVVSITLGLLLVSHFFPKIQFKMGADLSPTRVGFGNGTEMSPGDFSSLSDSGLPVFHVKTFPATSEDNRPYWHGFVLDQTSDGFHWMGGKNISSLKLENLTPASATIRQDFLLEPRYTGSGFALDYPFLLNPKSRMGDMESYSALSTYQPESLDSLSDEDRQRNLNLPVAFRFGPPGQGMRQLVRGMDRSHGEEKLISELLAFFSQGFRYSLNPGTYGPGEISKFLFERKLGFCEHFAGSFAVLLRLSGVPSRVVVGFHGGEWNSFDHSWLIRERDAHAWVEYWSSHRHAWLRIDPTSVIESTAVPRKISWFVQLEAAIDALSMSWKWMMVRYDVFAFRFYQVLDVVLRLAFFALVLISIFFGARTLTKWFRHKKTEDFEIFYQRFCQLMGKQGVTREPHEGPYSFLDRARALLSPEKYAICQEFTVLYVSMKYGPSRESDSLGLDQREMRRLLNLVSRIS